MLNDEEGTDFQVRVQHQKIEVHELETNLVPVYSDGLFFVCKIGDVFQ